MYSDNSLLALSVVLSAILSAAPALVALSMQLFYVSRVKMGNFVEITMERSKAKRALRQWSEPGLKKEKQEPTVSATRTVSFFQYLTHI